MSRPGPGPVACRRSRCSARLGATFLGQSIVDAAKAYDRSGNFQLSVSLAFEYSAAAARSERQAVKPETVVHEDLNRSVF